MDKQKRGIKGIPGRENKYTQRLKRTLWNLKGNAYPKKEKKAFFFFFLLEENKTPQLSLKPVDGIIFISSPYPVEIIYNNR